MKDIYIYIGKRLEKRKGASTVYLILHIFTNSEALQTLPFWGFIEASLQRRD